MNAAKSSLNRMARSKHGYLVHALVRHLCTAKMWNELERVLTDIHVLENKVNNGLAFELADDFSLAGKSVPEDMPFRQKVLLLEEAIRRDIHFIARHPSTLFQCLWNSCWWYDCPEASAQYRTLNPDREEMLARDRNRVGLHLLLEQWREQRKESGEECFWLRAVRIPDKRLGEGQALVLRGHTEAVHSLSFSADGSRILSAAYDRTARLWDAETGRPLCCLPNVEGWPCQVSFLHGKLPVVALACESVVRVLHVETGDVIATMKGHDDAITTLHVSEGGRLVVTAARDETVRLWDLDSGEEVLCIRTGSADVTAMGVSEMAGKMAFVVSGETLHVCDIASGCEVKHLADRLSRVALSFSPCGRWLALGGLGSLSLHDLATPGEVRELSGGAPLSATTLIWSPDGDSLVFVSRDRTIAVWSVNAGTIRVNIRGHEHAIECLAVSPDGRYLISGSEDTSIRKWVLSGAIDSYVPEGHSEQITGLDVCQANEIVATGSYDGTARIWSIQNGRQYGCLEGHTNIINQVVMSEDGRRLFSCSVDGTIRIWSVREMKEVACLSGHSRGVNMIDVSAKGDYIASASGDGTVRFWSVEERRELACLKGHTSCVQSLSLSRDCRRVAWGAFDSTIRVWDISKRREIARLYQRSDYLSAQPMVQFLYDSNRIALAWGDNTIRVWDLKDGLELAGWFLGESPIASLNVCKDGIHIVAMTTDHWVGLWDGHTLEPKGKLRGLISTPGDIEGVVKDAPRLPWRSVPLDGESVLVDGESGDAVAWCPDRFLSMSMPTRNWVCAVGTSLRMYCLEGANRCLYDTGLNTAELVGKTAYDEGDAMRPVVLSIRRRGNMSDFMRLMLWRLHGMFHRFHA